MLKDQLERNEEIKVNSREMEVLKNNFPRLFNIKGEFSLEKFKEMLKAEEINIDKEGYELKFLGKNYAKFQTSIETETVIVPDVDHNLKKENKDSENLYLVGDNIDALKHLLKSYSNKIKCIYIDPPYNTSSEDFIYSDKFLFTAETLCEKMGIEQEEAKRIVDLKGKSSHSAWLTFMYSRLELARDLLSDDGIIFISIDDNEQANLKLMCDEIFGEENFLSCITRSTGTPTGGGFDGIANELDYILIYSKNIRCALISGLTMDENSSKIYDQIDENGDRYLTRSLRRTGGEDRREDRPTMFYPLMDPDGMPVYPYGPTGYESRWICSLETAKELEKENLIEWKKVSRNQELVWHPYQKHYLEGRRKKPGNIWKMISETDTNLWDDISGNKKATLEVKNIFDDKKIFTSPKPLELLTKIITIANLKENEIVLDFFSGSATTAHAVMKLNEVDNGNRKYIMVQLPEVIKEDKVAYESGYRTIDEIGRMRIMKVGNEIKKINPSIDCGFKLIRLKEVNKNLLDRIIDFDSKELKIITDNFIEEFAFENTSGKETILATWLNQDGYGLSAKSKKIKLVSYEIDVYQNTAYIINEGIESQDIIKLIELVEDNKLLIDRVVVYPYSISFNILHEIKRNFKQLDNELKVIERY